MTTRRSPIRETLIVAGMLVVALVLIVLTVSPHVVVVPPQPTSTPVSDSGFHWALADDREFRVDKRYDAMSQTEKAQANDFAHRYPDGDR